MSFIQNGITFYTPADQTSQPISLMDGVISYLGDAEYRSPKSGFKLTGTYDAELRNPSPFGRVQVDSFGRVWLESASTLYVYAANQVQFFTSGYSINTRPPGNGTVFISDGFTQWSMARLKNNIEAIPPEISKKPLNPRRYIEAGKPRYGFVAELCPPEIVTTIVDEDNTEAKGVDILALCALQQAKIDDLEKRIEVLEAKK